jgi:hypothetical protein
MEEYDLEIREPNVRYRGTVLNTFGLIEIPDDIISQGEEPV